MIVSRFRVDINGQTVDLSYPEGLEVGTGISLEITEDRPDVANIRTCWHREGLVIQQRFFYAPQPPRDYYAGSAVR